MIVITKHYKAAAQMFTTVASNLPHSLSPSLLIYLLVLAVITAADSDYSRWQ